MNDLFIPTKGFFSHAHMASVLCDLCSDCTCENVACGRGICLKDTASEMTSFTPSRGDVAVHRSGLGPVFVRLRNPARSCVWTLVRSLVCVRPACLDGVLLCLLPAQPYVLCTCCVSSSRVFQPRQDPTINSCTISPPSLGPLRLFSIWAVKSTGLACAPLARCVKADVWSTTPTCWERPLQISEC